MNKIITVIIIVCSLAASFSLGAFVQSYETKRVKNDFTDYVHRGPEAKCVDGTVFSRTCHLPTWKKCNPNAEIIEEVSVGTQEHFIIHWKEK